MDGFWMDFQDHPRMITMLETLMAKLTMSQLGILALRLRNVLTQKLYGKEVYICVHVTISSTGHLCARGDRTDFSRRNNGGKPVAADVQDTPPHTHSLSISAHSPCRRFCEDFSD
jgi:hypothetical protein